MSDALRKRLEANLQRRRGELGRPLRDNFRFRFHEATGRSLEPGDFLTVEDSDALLDALSRHIEARPRPDMEWAGLSSEVFAHVAELGVGWGRERAFLAVAVSEFTGVASVPVQPLLANLAGFWMPDVEDIVLVTAGAVDGMVLEWYEDAAAELRSWGSFRVVSS